MLQKTNKRAFYQARKRRGDLERLESKLGEYSYSHIANVLNGYRKNDRIMNAAYRLSYRRVRNTELV